jgi:hypothetical protein
LSSAELLEEIAGRYRVVEPLGKGSFADAYLCHDTQGGGDVVVKLYDLKRSSWHLLTAFEREAAVLETLSHPAIPRYVEHRQLPDGRLILVQSRAPGKSLAERLRAGERFTDEQVTDLVEQVLRILAYLQSYNPPIIHRDIKPGNLVLDDSRGIHLVDFGSVKDTLRHDPEIGSTIAGTYGYMAPEQFQGRATVQSDLYGLGATVVHVLSLVPPSELPQEGLKLRFRDRIKASAGTARWLDRMLEPDPRHRFGDAKEALDAFRRRDEAAPVHAAGAPIVHVDDAPPAGSRIVLTRNGDELRLVIPAAGLSVEQVVPAGFATFWLGFVAFWTWGAGRASVLFAMFSLPFWVVGILMMIGALYPMFGETSILIGKSRFSLRKRLFGAGRTYEGDTAHLESASEAFGSRRGYRQSLPHSVLWVGGREIAFGSSLGRREREWVIAVINAHLERAARSRRPALPTELR